MSASLSCALAQFNPTLGNCADNLARILEWCQTAPQADLVLFPELALSGYPPEDLIYQADFRATHEQAWQALLQASTSFASTLVIGHLAFAAGRCYNAASVIHAGQVLAHYRKRALPNYGVFDEQRYFSAGTTRCEFEVKGLSCGLLICEDAWQAELLQAHQNCALVFILNASPYHQGKATERVHTLATNTQGMHNALVYVNQVGGQDELVFDGQSFVRDTTGVVTPCGAFGQESLCLALFRDGRWAVKQTFAPQTALAQNYAALVLGLRDYLRKNNFREVVLGLSGGVDSALVLALAVDAIGADKVHAVMLPSPYTASISTEDAAQIAHNFGVHYQSLSIAPAFEELQRTLAPSLAGRAPDVTEENLQARIRGTLLMALSNKFAYLLLATGNKSELAMGYCTLYGDMNGGFAPIKDVLKTEVYALCEYRNQQVTLGLATGLIPARILTRAPSAELRPDQTDQDSLPPYPVLDAIVRAWVEEGRSVEEIAALGHPRELVLRLTAIIRANEYKRRQGVIGPRISRVAFGRDWRMPQTNQHRLN